MDKVIIAVDAGGTKTKVVAINSSKKIVYEAIGGSGSPAVLGEKAVHNIFRLVGDAYSSIKDRYIVTFIQIGLSGFGVIEDIKKYEDELKCRTGIEVSMDSDTNMGLYSIIEDKYNQGVLILSGTGSAVAGIKDQQTILVGGFGVLLTESGSSYATVKSLIMNIIHQYEDSMTYSNLGKEFMEVLGARDISFFRSFMYTKTKPEIASYAKFVSKHASEGNEEAISILKKAGKDLALWVVKVFKNLNLDNNAIIGLRGGFIQNAPFVKEKLFKTLQDYNIESNISANDDDPIYGAYYMAKRKGKI